MRFVTPSFLTVAIISCVAACHGGSAPATPTPAATTTSMGEVNAPANSAIPGGGAFKGEINPTNNGTVTGIATMSGEGGNRTVVAMTLGGPPGTYTFEIHSGNCGNVGALMGDKSSYHPVVVPDSGSVIVRTHVAFYPPAGGTYALQIHQGSDPATEGNVVACGTMKSIQGP